MFFVWRPHRMCKPGGRSHLSLLRVWRATVVTSAGTPTAAVEEPQELLCPITMQVYRDPVFVPDSGNTYEARSGHSCWSNPSCDSSPRRTGPDLTAQSGAAQRTQGLANPARHMLTRRARSPAPPARGTPSCSFGGLLARSGTRSRTAPCHRAPCTQTGISGERRAPSPASGRRTPARRPSEDTQ